MEDHPPVVIVATEESLRAIPQGLREASLAGLAGLFVSRRRQRFMRERRWTGRARATLGERGQDIFLRELSHIPRPSSRPRTLIIALGNSLLRNALGDPDDLLAYQEGMVVDRICPRVVR